MMGDALEVAKVLVAPTMKLMDMIGGAIGTAYEPKHKRKMAEATAYEINTIGEALRVNSDAIVSYSNGQVTANNPEFEDFVKRTQHRLTLQELKRQQNIESVVDQAYAELEHETEVTNEPVEDDWISRLFDIVKDVNNEDMQKVWSKILAGEIKKPGSFSLRTLETLRNISQKEAETFQRILPFVATSTNDCFICSNDDIMEEFGINFYDLVILEECGLVKFGLSNNPSISSTMSCSLYTNNVIMILKGYLPETTKISYGIHLLTNAGKELYHLLAHEGNKEYMVKWAENIFSNQTNKVTIDLYHIVRIEGTMIYHYTEPFKTFCC